MQCVFLTNISYMYMRESRNCLSLFFNCSALCHYNPAPYFLGDVSHPTLKIGTHFLFTKILIVILSQMITNITTLLNDRFLLR